MNVPLTLRVQGGLLLFLGAALLLPIPFSLWFPRAGSFHDGALWAFLTASLVTLAAGWAIYRYLPARGEMTHREGFGIVTFGWILYALFGSLPYLLVDVTGIETPIDAFFEAMSGFSTTGSTVVTQLSEQPKSILFWRSLTQWLGGMGFIVLSLAILPFLGVGGMQLFEAEVPGPTKDRLSPRIQDTAKFLWSVYLLITLAEMLLLWMGEMDFFEAVCHSFTTMATGGFSTDDRSIAAFGSYTHVVITVFMLLAGVNFSLHYFAFQRDFGQYWRSEELRFYLAIVAAATGVIVVVTAIDSQLPGGPFTKLRDALFQSVSLMTTTGYATADYERWPAVAQYILVALMFVGGCAGSTAGSMKVVRLRLLLKHMYHQISRLIHPREVRALKLDHTPVSREVIQSILGFFALFITIFVVGSLAMAAILPAGADGNADLLTAASSVISALGNVGPGLGTVGPTETYTAMPALGKLVLAICMLVGRLELFTVMVLFFPSFWRK